MKKLIPSLTGVSAVVFCLAGNPTFAIDVSHPAAVGANAEGTLCALTTPVGSVLIQTDGRIVISGGGITWFYSQSSGAFGNLDEAVAVKRFDSEGSLEPTFGCRAINTYLYQQHLAVAPDGRVLMVGDFGTVEGEPRPGVALLLPDGKLDPAFVPWRGETNAHLNPASGFLRKAAVTGDGKVWIQGSRRQPTYSVESWVYQLSSDGSVAEVRQCDSSALGLPGPLVWILPLGGFCLRRPIDWSRTGPSEPVIAPPRPPDMAGWFAQGPFSGAQASGALQRIFASVPLEMCPYAVRLPDGGAILLVQEGDAGRLMRFDKDWRPDLSYTNGLRTRDGLRLALQRDGKLLAARSSDLHDIAGTHIGGVVRLNVDGTIDRTFRCETDERVMCVAAQPDGRVVIGGFFRRVNGVDSLSLARLWPDGSLDQGFLAHFKNPQALFASRRVPVRRLVLAAGSAVGGGFSAKPGTGPDPGSPAQSVLIKSLSVAGGVATVQFQGSPRQIYILQATDRLAESAWVNVNTNQTDASGAGSFREEGITNSAIRFYRVASPH